MKRFNFFKEALGSEKIPNPTNVAEQSLVEKLKLENAQLKAHIRKILKIRCAAKLRKRYENNKDRVQRVRKPERSFG